MEAAARFLQAARRLCRVRLRPRAKCLPMVLRRPSPLHPSILPSHPQRIQRLLRRPMPRPILWRAANLVR